MNKVADYLLRRATPQFGQFSLWILLGLALILSVLPFEHQTGERQPFATMWGFLPVEILESKVFFLATRISLAITAILWGLRIGTPVTSWLTALLFSLMWALRMENVANGAHIFHVATYFLFIYAAWYHFCNREIKEAWREKKFWSTPLYPNWVFFLCLFMMGWFHSWAGWFKIYASGLDWGNGLSLQLWTSIWGHPASPTTQIILSDRTIASIMQTGAMIFESIALLSLINRTMRVVIGLLLLGFYFGVLTTFVDYGFHFNFSIVLLFMMPVREFLESRAAKKQLDSVSIR